MKETDSLVEPQERFFDEISNIKYSLTHKAMRIKELVRLYHNDQLAFDTEYQREEPRE